MAEPEGSGEPPRRGGLGRRAIALIAVALGVAGFLISATGVVTQLLPRQFTAGQKQQIKAWEVAGRWQELTAGQIFPATVSYQLPAQVLQDSTPLNLDALRIGIAPQSGCGAGATTSAAAQVLRRDECKAVLRATYADPTRTYIMTVGVAVLPSDAAAADAYQSLSQLRLPRRAAPGRTRWRPASWWSATPAPRPRCMTTARSCPGASARTARI
jgi:hypothetical protein